MGKDKQHLSLVSLVSLTALRRQTVDLNGFFASLAGLFFGSISGALAGGYAAAYLSEKHN